MSRPLTYNDDDDAVIIIWVLGSFGLVNNNNNSNSNWSRCVFISFHWLTPSPDNTRSSLSIELNLDFISNERRKTRSKFSHIDLSDIPKKKEEKNGPKITTTNAHVKWPRIVLLLLLLHDFIFLDFVKFVLNFHVKIFPSPFYRLLQLLFCFTMATVWSIFFKHNNTNSRKNDHQTKKLVQWTYFTCCLKKIPV